IEPMVIKDLRRDLPGEPTKVLALCENPGVLDGLLSSMRLRYTPAELYLTRSVATFFEATHPVANKGDAVQYLAEELLGLQAANVMAIGDNFNDVEMIAYAGVGVAMGNAPDGVKAAADWVAPDVEEDGVVAAIEQFVLGDR
ncbi:HAD-IIB family hydrolase, partial [Microcoleus sp. HI-ES]|nr:HAD-IIB family hydrolase [Microcoleus sp. HI-ES]